MNIKGFFKNVLFISFPNQPQKYQIAEFQSDLYEKLPNVIPFGEKILPFGVFEKDFSLFMCFIFRIFYIDIISSFS